MIKLLKRFWRQATCWHDWEVKNTFIDRHVPGGVSALYKCRKCGKRMDAEA